MPSSAQDDKVALTMTVDDYHQLLELLGFAIGAAMVANRSEAEQWTLLVNKIYVENDPAYPKTTN